tara:strand:+ start:9491 stop:11197 length:1707 start_codon:yes stop_codon:yes gene_type:complete
MGFDYDKLRAKHEEGGNQWASYSDLFMVLSVVFLLLYVTTSLRGGTNSLQNNIEYQELVKEVTELRQQNKVYETLKEDYLQKGASQDEQESYNELMGKLSLLQEEAQQESEDLMKQASENQKKKAALNKYQKMIKNIINSNMVASARIKKRDTVIKKKDITIQQKQKIIAEKREQIKDLNQDINQKENQIIENNEKIQAINMDLQASIMELQNERREAKLSKAKMRRRVAELKVKSQERINALKDQNKTVEKQMNRIELELTSAENLLKKANKEIETQAQRRQRLQAKLQREKQRAQEVENELQAEAQRKSELQEQLKAESSKSSKLSSKLQAEAARKAQLQAALKQTKDEVASKESKISNLTKEFKAKLAKERAKADARKKLISDIKKNFKKAGIKAKIDGKTGEVILEFGDEYFDTGKADLKNNMQKILDKSVPVYAQSLFKRKKIAKNIANVEIVGFASPTYRGKFVDPDSLDPAEQKATSYNLDLSYRRAKAIFDHIFDTRKMTFSEQRRLRKIIKVTGRGYLDVANEIKTDRRTASTMSASDFCKATDCKKYQRVIIKFNLKN